MTKQEKKSMPAWGIVDEHGELVYVTQTRLEARMCKEPSDRVVRVKVEVVDA